MIQESNPAIQIRGLVKRFARFHLGPLDLNIPTGTIYGLIGPNGAGKTTTIDLIMGMGIENEGSIEVLGLEHRANEAEIKRHIGYVSPELSYSAWGKIGRLLAFLRPFYPTWDNVYCAALLKRFGLEESQRISTLSLGNRTRLSLVAALAHRPKLLILDEPTSGLDAVAKVEFFEEILSLMQSEDRSVLISSHSLADLERFADYVGMIHQGRLLLEGPCSELIERYQILDLKITNGFRPESHTGLRVLRRESDRCRVLIDSSGPGVSALHGVEVLASAQVTLEELFVALIREEVAC